MKFEENKMQHDFPKMRGGGQRPFGTFPKIPPFWKGEAYLSALIDLIEDKNDLWAPLLEVIG